MPSSAPEPVFRLGLIVNPIAGLGGAVGLKGTDGASAEEALRRGARPLAQVRAARALTRLRPGRARLLVAGGAMGEAVARDSGFTPVVVTAARTRTDAGDTRRAAEALRREHADLILFAGGDGTARDVYAVLGREVPMLGIPTGVKMHSAAFATSPENAGWLAEAAAAGAPMRCRDAEIVDLDETLLRLGIVSTRLHGVARVPYERLRVQHAKQGAGTPEAALEAVCAEIAASLGDGLVLFGPGTTTQRVLAHLGLSGTLLGVDAVAGGRLVAADLAEAAILRLLDGRAARLVVGVVGGQGFLFGRGNQQLSAPVLRRIGAAAITVVAGADKLMALPSGELFVDTGDPALDRELSGFRRVRTSPGQSLLCKVMT